MVSLGMVGCRGARPDRTVAVVAIESSPTSLDPRVGTDAQSERIDELIFDPLVRKDEHFLMRPALAERWEQTDARTWVFHLRRGARFHDGRPVEAEDVAWTIRSMTDGTVVTAKGGAFAGVERLEVRDPGTLVVHLRKPDASLLFNLSDGLFGVVPRGAGRELARAPVGSGPFQFVSEAEDKEVVLRRNDLYWDGPVKLRGVRFAVVPDAITTALELEKGGVDAESNAITLDMVHALRGRRGLRIETGPSSMVMYLNLNTTDGALADVRVRQAIACAIDRRAIVDALWRGQARLAQSLLPPEHWAHAPADELARYPWDPARARSLLDAAGFRPDAQGVRLRLTMKTSTDETTRLMALILQQQMRAVGIELGVRAAEFGTFYADITRGAFQMYALRWIGSNEDPDIFRYSYASSMVPPRGGNRGHFQDAQLDSLLAGAEAAASEEEQRRLYVDVQRRLSVEVPTVPLWYPNNEVVRTERLRGVTPTVNGSYDWLRSAWIE